MQAITKERIAAGVALVAILVLHALTPTKAAPENTFGYISGYSALVLCIVTVVGLVRRKEWGRQLLGVMGLAIFAGFLLLHFIPYQSVLTDPYVGRDAPIGIVPWTVVFVAMVIGLWAAYAAFRKSEHEPMRTASERFS